MENTQAADDLLAVGQRRTLTMYFHFPEATGNSAQAKDLTFTLCADATQTRTTRSGCLTDVGETVAGEKSHEKTFEVIKTVLTWLIVLLAVCMMVFTIVSVTTFDRNDRALFGYKMYIVRSDSMSATDFKAGDLILVRSVDPATLQEGISSPIPRRTQPALERP